MCIFYDSLVLVIEPILPVEVSLDGDAVIPDQYRVFSFLVKHAV